MPTGMRHTEIKVIKLPTSSRRSTMELSQVYPAAKWAPKSAGGKCSASSGGGGAGRNGLLPGPPASSVAAVELEVLRASALDRLRKTLNAACVEAGMGKGAPLLAFER